MYAPFSSHRPIPVPFSISGGEGTDRTVTPHTTRTPPIPPTPLPSPERRIQMDSDFEKKHSRFLDLLLVEWTSPDTPARNRPRMTNKEFVNRVRQLLRMAGLKDG